MRAFTPQHEGAHGLSATGELAQARKRARSRNDQRELRTRRAIAGRFVLIWVVAYAALRISESQVHAGVGAVVVGLVWVVVGVRVAQTFRSMTFAFGPFAVATTTTAFSLVAISMIAYWVPSFDIGRASLVLVGIVTTLAVGLWEFLVQRAAPPPPRRVLVVGGRESTARLVADLARDRADGYELVGIVADEPEPEVPTEVPRLGTLDQLPETVRRSAPDLVVVAVATGRPQVFASLLEVADAGFQVTGLPEMYEFAFGRLPVEDLTSAWFMSVLHAYQRPSNKLGKRAFDILMALFGLIIALPLLPFILIVVKKTKGPLFYRQVRLGEHGRLFTMIKFRSMRVDAEAAGTALWASKDDPRVIPGGRLLRLLRFDEIPQLWNVLRGEMSIVGPRPERPEFVEQLQAEVPFWTQRHLLKPGITGWAQIRSGYAADSLGTAEKLSYDLWYLRHRNLVLDTTICLKTVPQMLLKRGAR